MEAARTFETLVNFYQTTWRYKPEDSHLRTHRRENLKSYLLGTVAGLLISIYYEKIYKIYHPQWNHYMRTESGHLGAHALRRDFSTQVGSHQFPSYLS
jgi:hypothetical protein